MATPKQNMAAWMPDKGVPIQVGEAPVPVPQDNEILIRTHSVAFNPADGAMNKLGILIDKWPAVGGCDVAGIVESVGSAVTRFQPGDRILGYTDHVPRKRENDGAYQLYCCMPELLSAKLPENVSFTEGCVLPLALGTAAVAIFTKGKGGLELPYPTLGAKPTGKAILVWGGSSSVGSCAIQLAKAAGVEVATTCSARNVDYCKEVGADYVFDHGSETVVEDVVKALKDKEFAGAFDAVMPPETIIKSAEIAHQLGGKKHVATVLPGPPTHMVVPDGLPEDVVTSYTYGAPKNDPELQKAVFVDFFGPALEKGLLKAYPRPQVVGRGLESIQPACDKISEGVSATKLVVELA